MNDRALAIRNEIGIEQLATIFVQSGFFSDTQSQAQALVKMIAGAEIGFGPMASMQGVDIIKGQTSMGAGLVAAAIQRSGKYTYRVVENTNDGCTIDFFEHLGGGDREKIGTSSFTTEDAKAAGLLGNTMYAKYPRNMLFSRALTNGARWYCPEVFSGSIYTPDELGEDPHIIDIKAAPEGPKSVPTDVREVDDADIIRSADDRLWGRWMALLADANKFGVAKPPKGIRLPIARSKLIEAGMQLDQLVRERQQLLADEDAARAAAAPEPEAPQAGSPPAGAEAAPLTPLDRAWKHNRQLQAEAYPLGLRLRDLDAKAGLEDVQHQNEVIASWLESRPRMPL